ncbi:AP2-like ethylene-responsive transcription factor CRL5 isoform X1 [Zea mays]|uniref:AP2-like ethylene-responsive transcription factor CRL5 isoform X1 n=1 Tax=Zea mays TaxID=4577 RepID=UPI0009AAAE84|nr:AP2-like ethylene-responsive transcription factor CRL5 isoform X1 [Zea mays]XP_035816050.1 AP2-like ethylene-responsive transcription factor CRL5 isoform X1 [Zea mays]|eukprot:XP_020395081.1 AP2-like ethylene-responsive transcription factor AIL1 isoform X1 [Zea mays]
MDWERWIHWSRHRWTGRYEAHLWDNSCRKDGQTRKGKQGFAMTECDWLHAPHSISRWLRHRRQDNEGLRSGCSKILGPATHVNFPVENYRDELEEMKGMTRQEFVAHLRRRSSGFSRGASIYRGVTRHHQQGRWQSRIGRVAGNKDLYLDTFSRLHEAVQEKEHGLDSLGRIPCYICALFSRTHSKLRNSGWIF